MNFGTAAIIALATFGATYIIRYQDGPFHVFHRLRVVSGIEYVPVLNDNGLVIDCVEEVSTKFFAQLLGCHWCLGTWVAGFLTTLAVALGYVPMTAWMFYWLMACGVTGFLCDVVRGEIWQE